MKKELVALLIALVVTGSACGGKGFVVHPIVDLADEPNAPPEVKVSLPPLVLAGSAHERALLRRLAADTDRLIQSDDFKRFVVRMTFASRTAGAPVPGATVLRDYLGETQRLGTSRPLQVLGRSWGSIAIAYFKNGEVYVGLRTPVMERAASASREVRACAINSLAHEWVHAVIETTANGPRHAYQDGGHSRETRPLASYAIGAIAQCAYLREEDSSLDMRTCVEHVGISSFNPDSCRVGWVAELKANKAPEVAPPPPPPPSSPAFWSQIEVLCASRSASAMQASENESLRQFCDGEIGIAELVPGDRELRSTLEAIRAEHVAARGLLPDPVSETARAEFDARGDAIHQIDDVMKLTASDIPTSGAVLGGAVVEGLADILSGRVKAELQLYAIDSLRRLLCRARRPWFQNTCVLIDDADDELPLVFGTALRAAIVGDLARLPERVVAAPMVGGRAQLAAALFAGVSRALMARADIATAADEVSRIVDTVFTCEKADDAECARLVHASRFIAAATTTVLRGGTPPGEPLIGAVRALAAQQGLVLPPGEPEALIQKVLDARHLGEVLFDARGDARLDAVKPLVEAVVEVFDHGMTITGVGRRMPGGLPELVDALARGKIEPLVTAMLTVLRELPLGKGSLDARTLRLFAFLGEIAQAKDSASAKAAIEAVIAPVGAHRMKRSRWIASVNAFVGLSVGSERLSGGPLQADDSGQSGTLAPVGYVGVDLSVPLRNSAFPHAGVFVSVIDVGSLLNYRWGSGKVAVEPDGTGDAGREASVSQSSNVGFAQVFSPGLFIRVGIGNSPLVIGGGAAFVPDARRVTTSDGALDEDVSAIRYNAFIAVDVTLLPFHL